MLRKYNVIEDPREGYLRAPTFKLIAQDSDAAILSISGFGYDAREPSLTCQFKGKEELMSFIETLPLVFKQTKCFVSCFNDKGWDVLSDDAIKFDMVHYGLCMNNIKPLLFHIYQFSRIEPKVIGMLFELFRGHYGLKADDVLGFARDGDNEMALTLLDSIGLYEGSGEIFPLIDENYIGLAIKASLTFQHSGRMLCHLGKYCLELAETGTAHRIKQAVQCYQAAIDYADDNDTASVHEAKLKLMLLRNNRLNDVESFAVHEQEELLRHAFYSSNVIENQSLKMKLFNLLCGRGDKDIVGSWLTGDDPEVYIKIAREMRDLAVSNAALRRENERLKAVEEKTHDLPRVSRQRFF